MRTSMLLLHRWVTPPNPLAADVPPVCAVLHCAAVWDSFKTLKNFWQSSFASSAVDLRAHRWDLVLRRLYVN